MTRYTITIRSEADRERAIRYVRAAPSGCRVDVKAAKRSIPQNDRMWAMLTDVAEQVLWHGQKLRPDDYKLIFLDALKRELRVVPNLDGNGFVNLGRSSSDLTKGEHSDLMELIAAWGAEHGVVFSGDRVQPSALAGAARDAA